jgi:cytochrome oxidase assembly protein ShyY1
MEKPKNPTRDPGARKYPWRVEERGRDARDKGSGYGVRWTDGGEGFSLLCPFKVDDTRERERGEKADLSIAIII